MNLYFGNFTSIISTILVIGVFIYIGITIGKQNEITSWGKRIIILALWGLLICIFAAARDGYALSVQVSMGEQVSPGLFTLDSIQSTLGCIGGAVIAFCSLSSIFVRKQGYRKAMFFILSAAIIFKTLVIEISRILL
jgi:hypothetical protein